MIYEKFIKITDDRIVASLIGMPKAKFTALVKAFETTDLAIQQERVKQGEIKHAKLGGAKGNLDTYEKKLFFVLYYLKTYPTFDVLGFHFGFSGGHAHAHVDRLLPVLRRSLADLGLMPERTAGTPAEFNQLIDKYKDIVIDGVECACVRPQHQAEQEMHYSGKKKTYGQIPGRLRFQPEDIVFVLRCGWQRPRLHTHEKRLQAGLGMVRKSQFMARPGLCGRGQGL